MKVSAIASKIYQAAKAVANGVWNWRLEWSKAMKQAWRQVIGKGARKMHSRNFFRIVLSDYKTIKYAGTGHESCFSTFEEARKHCDYSDGEMIYETNGVIMLHEVL